MRIRNTVLTVIALGASALAQDAPAAEEAAPAGCMGSGGITGLLPIVAMVAIFMYIRFVLYKKLSRAVAASEWAAGGAALAQIRTLVSINLGLGVLVLLVTLMRWAA